MAEHKKSVVFYTDLIHTFEKLNDSQAGKLIKHYLRYVNDMKPKPPDKITELLFEPIKQQLKRDLRRWEQEKLKRAKAGKIGGIKSGQSRRSEANEASASKSKQIEANEADNVNVTVNVNDNVIERENAPIFSIEHCLTVVMNDERWVRVNKATVQKLEAFNQALEKQGIYHKNPADYKKHYASWSKHEQNGTTEKKMVL